MSYVRGNFFYGREFLNDHDLNAQLERWLARTANVRIHGTTKQQPTERFERDERVFLQPLAARPYRPLILIPAEPQAPLASRAYRPSWSSAGPSRPIAGSREGPDEGAQPPRPHPRSARRSQMPGALEALDQILSGIDGGTLGAPEAIENLLGAQISLRNNRRLQAAMLVTPSSVGHFQPPQLGPFSTGVDRRHSGDENRRLKRIVADQALNLQVLKDLLGNEL